jgi:hypothetical protein
MIPRVLESTAAWLLESVGRKLWGFAPRLMPVIAQSLGGVGALSWFARNMPRYESTLRALGPIRTHLLCTAISLSSGCPYCTHGHAHAFELYYLRQRGVLFPVSERDLVALGRLDRVTLRARWKEALAQGGLHDEIGPFDRLCALLDGAEANHADDARLAHLIKMFAVLNACGIEGNVEPDEAHDAINKDTALRQRYADLRRAAVARAAPPPG